jgi:hypothetical protein
VRPPAWASIGYTLHRLGRHPDAITCHQRALALYCDLGDRHHQADTLTKLSDSQHAVGTIKRPATPGSRR